MNVCKTAVHVGDSIFLGEPQHRICLAVVITSLVLREWLRFLLTMSTQYQCFQIFPLELLLSSEKEHFDNDIYLYMHVMLAKLRTYFQSKFHYFSTYYRCKVVYSQNCTVRTLLTWAVISPLKEYQFYGGFTSVTTKKRFY